jgi:hypothetical protein
MTHRVISRRCGFWSLPGKADIGQTAARQIMGSRPNTDTRNLELGHPYFPGIHNGHALRYPNGRAGI